MGKISFGQIVDFRYRYKLNSPSGEMKANMMSEQDCRSMYRSLKDKKLDPSETKLMLRIGETNDSDLYAYSRYINRIISGDSYKMYDFLHSIRPCLAERYADQTAHTVIVDA